MKNLWARSFVVIDEAATIPLPVVRRLMQSNDPSRDGGERRLTFVSSTVNG